MKRNVSATFAFRLLWLQPTTFHFWPAVSKLNYAKSFILNQWFSTWSRCTTWNF